MVPHASTDSVRGLPLTLTHTLLCVQMQGALGCMSSNIDIVPSAQLCMPNFDFAQLRRAIEQAGVARAADDVEAAGRNSGRGRRREDDAIRAAAAGAGRRHHRVHHQ